MERYKRKFEEQVISPLAKKQFLKVKKIYNEIYKQLLPLSTSDKTIPSGPNSQIFRATQSGGVNLYFNTNGRNVGFTKNPYDFAIILQVGGAIKSPFNIQKYLDNVIQKKTLFKKTKQYAEYSFEEDGILYTIKMFEDGGTNFRGYFCYFFNVVGGKSNKVVL